MKDIRFLDIKKGSVSSGKLDFSLLKDYWVVLVNATDNVITRQRVKVGNNEWTAWTRLSNPVGRTCTGNLNSCAANGEYEAVMVVDCGGLDFEIELRADNGFGDIWLVQPDCQADGGWVGLGG